MTAAGMVKNPELSPWEECRLADFLIARGAAPNLSPQ
jgi:hypothetical protein